MTKFEEDIIRRYLGDVWLAWDGEEQPFDGASFTVYRKDEWSVCDTCDYLTVTTEYSINGGRCDACKEEVSS